jgi:Na+-translocating ferredoxin:NAD+ oxidoreductase subunit B
MPASAPTPDDDLYRALQRHLDRMPVPYPATESGVELSILRRLFSPEDARAALLLSVIPEPLTTIHRRARRTTSRTALEAALDGMAARGLIQRVTTARGPLYGKAPLVVGFYESQVNRLTPELQRDFERYGDEVFGAALAAHTPQLRTVPVNEPIPFERVVGRYDDMRAFVRASPGPFAVMNCICQQGKDLVGQPCRQTHDREHCLTIGSAAESLAGRGVARLITKDEMLGFLDRADREGLVVEPQNTQDPMFICCCCGCCCGVLTAAKKLPHPASAFATNYHAAVDAAVCNACVICESRCQMGAIACDLGPAAVNLDRCIGCGLCVTACPTGAMSLVMKPDARVPPKDIGRLYGRMYRERFGALGVMEAIARRVIGAQS